MNQTIATCAGLPFRAATQLRNFLYDRRLLPIYRSSLPVISIGNLSVGGNAKTPLSIYIARELRSRGFQPVVLTRGYGSKVKPPYLVKSSDDSELVGDEPLLLARQEKFPVVICPDRVVGCKWIEKERLADLVILDDGFQHRRLYRDIDLVSIDIGTNEAQQKLIQGQLLPFGRFREDVRRALQRADLVVFSDRKPFDKEVELSSNILELVPKKALVFRSFFEVTGIKSPSDGSGLSAKNITAFCGIASPSNFFETLETLGFNIRERREFSDHHRFELADVEKLSAFGFPLVCTAKDWVKLAKFNLRNVFVLEIQARIRPEDAFFVQLQKKLRD